MFCKTKRAPKRPLQKHFAGHCARGQKLAHCVEVEPTNEKPAHICSQSQEEQGIVMLGVGGVGIEMLHLTSEKNIIGNVLSQSGLKQIGLEADFYVTEGSGKPLLRRTPVE